MKRLWFAFLHSINGLKAAWRDEAAFREEIILAVVLMPAAFYLAPDRISLAVMLATVLIVLIVELLNTAIEAAIDRHGPERHPMAKKAKDAASAAVLIALVVMAVVWIVLLF
jgi:diacylglycerol kinase (ATP)